MILGYSYFWKHPHTTHGTKKKCWHPIKHTKTNTQLPRPSDIHVARGDSTRAFWNATSRPLNNRRGVKGFRRWRGPSPATIIVIHLWGMLLPMQQQACFCREMMNKKSAEKNTKDYVCHHKEVSPGMVPCWSGLFFEPGSSGRNKSWKSFLVSYDYNWHMIQTWRIVCSFESWKEDIGNGECCGIQRYPKILPAFEVIHWTTRLGTQEETSHLSHEKNPRILSMGNPGCLMTGSLFHGLFQIIPYMILVGIHPQQIP